MPEPRERHVVRLPLPSRVVALEDAAEAPAAAVADLMARTIRSTTQVYREMDIASEIVPLSATFPVLRSARQERYTRATAFVDLLEAAGIERFVPTLLRFAREWRYRLVLPPVLEEHGRQMVVVDGSHRLKVLYDRDVIEARCVVIRPRHDAATLPAPPAALIELQDMHVGNYVSKGRKFEDFNKGDFRPVASHLRRGDEFQYPDVKSARAACRRAFEDPEGRRL